MFDKSHSEYTIQKQREKALNREKIECKHCKKLISPGMYKRWHGDNCKNKSN
jgi:uncharacterized CHY-type Zn-finger protein